MSETKEAPVTVPGVRVLLTNGQTLDFPLVDNINNPTKPTYEEVSAMFKNEQIDFPISKIGVMRSAVMLFTLIEMNVMTAEEAEAAAAAAAAAANQEAQANPADAPVDAEAVGVV